MTQLNIRAACPICHYQPSQLLFTVYDDRYNYPGHFTIHRCPECGHEFNPAGLSGTLPGDLYTRYYPRAKIDENSIRPPQKHGPIVSWLNGEKASPSRWVTPGTRVLDIGCGTGENLLYLQQRECDAYGIEVDENIVRFASRHGLKIHHGQFTPGIYGTAFFDCVIMEQVFEHLADPAGVLRGVHQVLRRQGTIIFSFPNAHGWGRRLFRRRWIHWHAPYHVHFYSKRSLSLLLSRGGFRIRWLKTVTPSDWLYFQMLHIAFHPKRGNASAFWTGTIHGFFARFIKYAFALLKYCGVFHLVTRLFDLFGAGDNFVVIAEKAA